MPIGRYSAFQTGPNNQLAGLNNVVFIVSCHYGSAAVNTFAVAPKPKGKVSDINSLKFLISSSKNLLKSI